MQTKTRKSSERCRLCGRAASEMGIPRLRYVNLNLEWSCGEKDCRQQAFARKHRRGIVVLNGGLARHE